MARVEVSATKSNLMKMKDELSFARDGKDLLSQKREVLVMEMLRLQDEARKVREDLDQLLERAYAAFITASLLEGFDGMQRLALAIRPGVEMKLEERSVMGVILPIVSCEGREWRPDYGLGQGSHTSDRTVQLFLEVASRLCEVAEIETAIYRLAMETRKTIRRERALENKFIPEYSASIKYIEDTLEERERETFYQLKLIKGN
ncbi:MAG: V-type ATP synthase subunit D [Desulfuromonadales bacterium]